LEGLAAVAVRQGRLIAAARYFGAAEGVRDTIGTSLLPGFRAVRARFLSALEAEMSPAALAEAWEEGRLAQRTEWEMVLSTTCQ
jgi:hypothetical protein